MSKLREPVNSLTHYTGAIFAAVGSLALLIFGREGFLQNIALGLYGLTLIQMFTASAVYHSARVTPRVLGILRKIDHSAIYLLIAGTYTPFCVLAFSGFWRWGFLAIIWALALSGVMVKVFIIHAPRWINAGVYVVMGWLCLFAVNEMLKVLAPDTIGWLLAGGIIYTLGAVVYATKRMNFKPGVFGFHEVWHIFVLLGAGAHFLAVASLVHI